MPQLKDRRAVVMFKGDEGKYELDYDFGGEVGNLVNLEDLMLATEPSGKFRIVEKESIGALEPGEPPMVVYHLEKF